MAILRENLFNGGLLQDGLFITAGNSGGGNGHNVNSVTGVGGQFTSANYKSAPGAMKVVNPTVATSINWSSLGSLTTAVYFRVYLYLTANPVTNDLRLMHYVDNTATLCAAFDVFTSGVITCRIASGGGGNASGTIPVTLNKWVRLEGYVIPSTTVGVVAWRLFNDTDSLVPTEQKIASGLVLGANVDGVRLGIFANTPALPFSALYDNWAIGDDWIGPTTSVPRGAYQ